MSNNLFIVSSSNLNDIILAGFPATIAYGGIFFATTAPAPIIAPSPIVTQDITFASAPNHTSFPIIIGPFASACVPTLYLPLKNIENGYVETYSL